MYLKTLWRDIYYFEEQPDNAVEVCMDKKEEGH
jgi:hypothetical protein